MRQSTWLLIALFSVSVRVIRCESELQLSQPVSGTTHIDYFQVGWQSTGGVPPIQIQVFARYVSGYATVTPPSQLVITLSRGHLAMVGRLYVQPMKLLHSADMTVFPEVVMVDGQYELWVVYTPVSGSPSVSRSVTIHSICNTLPAQVLSPLPHSYHIDPLINFRIFLPSTPSSLAPITARVFNTTFEMEMVLSSDSATIEFVFVTNTALIQVDAVVVSLTKHVQLQNGTYSFDVTYKDDRGHDFVTSSVTEFSIGPPPPGPVCPPCAVYNRTVTITKEVIVNRTVTVPQIMTVEVVRNQTVFVNTTCDPCATYPPVSTESSETACVIDTFPDYVVGGKASTALFAVCLIISFVLGIIATSIACLWPTRKHAGDHHRHHHHPHSDDHQHDSRTHSHTAIQVHTHRPNGESHVRSRSTSSTRDRRAHLTHHDASRHSHSHQHHSHRHHRDDQLVGTHVMGLNQRPLYQHIHTTVGDSGIRASVGTVIDSETLQNS